MEALAALAERHDLLVVSDEMYDPIVYDGRQAACFATLPGMGTGPSPSTASPRPTP